MKETEMIVAGGISEIIFDAKDVEAFAKELDGFLLELLQHKLELSDHLRDSKIKISHALLENIITVGERRFLKFEIVATRPLGLFTRQTKHEDVPRIREEFDKVFSQMMNAYGTPFVIKNGKTNGFCMRRLPSSELSKIEQGIEELIETFLVHDREITGEDDCDWVLLPCLT